MTAPNSPPSWWHRPRQITVLVDNPSWVLPYAERIVQQTREAGDDATLARSHDEVGTGVVAIFLGCVRLSPPEVLARNRRNLVIHESDLPRGRGFAPLTWQVLEGRHDIPVCLLEAGDVADGGPIIYREHLHFQGNELIPEMREALGGLYERMIARYLAAPVPPEGTAQQGDTTSYRRRHPRDSALDPGKTLAEQFDLLRVVDNERYPAFFDHRGRRYRLQIDVLKDDTSR